MPTGDTYKLNRRDSSTRPLADPESLELSDSDSDLPSDSQSTSLLNTSRSKRKPSPQHPFWSLFSRSQNPRPRIRRRRRARICVSVLLYTFLLLLVFTALPAIFSPSYTKSRYPAHFLPLEEAITAGGGEDHQEIWLAPPDAAVKKPTPGRGNPNNEQIFIAANIVDAELITSEWGWRVMELLDILGPENVFLSIFENDSGEPTIQALKTLDERIAAHFPRAGRSIVSTTLPYAGVPRVVLPDGKTYIKRITYLAEVRNRALLPLVGSIPSLARWNQTPHPAHPLPPVELSEWETLLPLPANLSAPQLPDQWVDSPEKVSRILFLNDVVFSPSEMAHLLFSTHEGNYSAACGADYISPFKFYDTFATRDKDGLPLGVPFFPYFITPSPRAQVLATSDAVDVASCWGGAIAFNASYFTRPDPVLFRSEKQPFWEASECCLINADLDAPGEIFMNPFVRSAYDRGTFEWLPVARRVERGFAWAHWVVGKLLRMPWAGEKVGVREGEKWMEKAGDGKGGVREWEVVAGKGMMCGSRKLLVLNEDRKEGEKSWLGVEVPPAEG